MRKLIIGTVAGLAIMAVMLIGTHTEKAEAMPVEPTIHDCRFIDILFFGYPGCLYRHVI